MAPSKSTPIKEEKAQSVKEEKSAFKKGFSLALHTAVILLVYRLAIVVHHSLMLKFPDTFYNDPYRNIANVGSNCTVSMQEVRSAHNIHTLAAATKFIKKFPGEPILFKGFISNPLDQWEVIEQHHKDVPIHVHELQLENFGNIFFAGAQPDPKSSVETTVGECVNKAYAPGSERALFGSFISFLDPSFDPDPESKFFTGMKIIADTSFLSNFPEDLLASPLHYATTINSYAVQYVGRKLWLMVAPPVFESFGAYSTPASFPLSGSEKELFERTNGIQVIAVQEEGDMLFFPPQWGHAVVTKAGKNVMINYREFALFTALWTNPFRCIEAGISGLLSRTNSAFRHHGVKIESEMKRIDYQLEHREKHDNPDSTCKDIWKSYLYR